MLSIRPATPDDTDSILPVHGYAFPTLAEAHLVGRIVQNNHDELSLVAEWEGRIIGHVLFSPVTIERDGRVVGEGLGLAPVAVLPEHQRQGIGSALIRAGLDALAAAGCPFVVVLGEPEYYRRFGFATASKFGIANEYDVDEPFMIVANVEPLPSGLAKYGAEFAEL